MSVPRNLVRRRLGLAPLPPRTWSLRLYAALLTLLVVWQAVAPVLGCAEGVV